MNTLILVNAAHPLPRDYAPDSLVSVNSREPQVLLEREAAERLTMLVNAVGGWAHIAAVSGWRSRAEQRQIWDDAMAEHGAEFTRQFVALPDCSEHLTGLAIDLALRTDCIDFLCPDFPSHGVCGRLRRLAPSYGFILRYPQGKERITGIAHEPWHFRYVGIPHAARMTDGELTLEEYIAQGGAPWASAPD